MSEMSDRSSTGSISEDDYDGYGDNQLDYEPRRADLDEQSESADGDGTQDEQDVDDGDVDNNDRIDISKLVLCQQHKQGEMMNSCPTCSTAFKLIKDKDVIEKLTLKSSGSGLLSRYQGRIDSIEPTLSLTSETVQLAHSVFTKGLWKDPKLFKEVVKKFLTIPPEHHELLSSDLNTEDILNKFRSDPRFRSIFKYVNELASALKLSRIAQRPLFALMERVNYDIDKVVSLGKAGDKCREDGVAQTQDIGDSSAEPDLEEAGLEALGQSQHGNGAHRGCGGRSWSARHG